MANEWAELLMASTQEMFAGGEPLMSRVLPEDAVAEIWEHYPDGDVINGEANSRFFYHSHPPGQRIKGEHGHFHLFLGKEAMSEDIAPLISAPPQAEDAARRSDVVHIAALSISTEGLPMQWFTTNRWVTDEWLYPAKAIIAQLDRFDMRGPNGDPLINDWLTAMVQLSKNQIAGLLLERDTALSGADPSGENHAGEMLSTGLIDLERLFEGGDA